MNMKFCLPFRHNLRVERYVANVIANRLPSVERGTRTGEGKPAKSGTMVTTCLYASLAGMKFTTPSARLLRGKSDQIVRILRWSRLQTAHLPYSRAN